VVRGQVSALVSAAILVERAARDGFARTARARIGPKALATPAVLEVDTPFAPAGASARARLVAEGGTGGAGITFAWGPSPLFPGHKAPPHTDVVLPRLVPRGYTVAPLLGPGELVRQEGAAAGALPSREGSQHLAPLAKDAALVALQNLNELRGKPREFVRAVAGARHAIGPRPLLFAPAVADPASLALLTYLGIDLTDDFQAIAAASAGVFLYNFGSVPGGLAGACHCAACAGYFPESEDGSDKEAHAPALADSGDAGAELGEGRGALGARSLPSVSPDSAAFKAALAHNRLALTAEAKIAARAIENGTLRELVEARIRAHPWLVAALRNFDREFAGPAEDLTPVWKERLHALSHESLHRPEVERWVGRIRARYSPPPSARVLLLVPCSARKPYSLSKTQHTISRALAGIRPAFAVHRAIVTSPLGVVPEELERVFPAAHYDIPVTGDWAGEEADRVFELVASIARSHPYRAVVSLVGDDLPGLQEQVAGTIECAAKGTPWEQSLTRAADAVREALKGERDVDPRRRTLEDLQSVGRFQFGKAAGDALFEGAAAKGRYPWNRILAGKVQLAQHFPDKGRLSLTLEGAKRVAAAGAYRVTVSPFELKGDVFAVGVTAVDPEVCEGDSVAVVRDGKVIAAGFARMAAAEMLAMRRGSAVDIRHKG
jgi:archaeosine synthase